MTSYMKQVTAQMNFDISSIFQPTYKKEEVPNSPVYYSKILMIRAGKVHERLLSGLI